MLTLKKNIDPDAVVNAMFDMAEGSIKCLRRAYSFLRDRRWRQTQRLKLQLLTAQIQDSAAFVHGAYCIAKSEIQLIMSKGGWVFHKMQQQARRWAGGMMEAVVQAMEAVAIALSWFAFGEEVVAELVTDCWQLYVDWADNFVEGRLEPLFDFAPVEVKLLAAPVKGQKSESISPPFFVYQTAQFGEQEDV